LILFWFTARLKPRPFKTEGSFIAALKRCATQNLASNK
jgi:hypothetical protein